VYVLFDGENGAPLACIDGTALTLRKTAADSALGAKLLAPPAPRSLLMVGAGAMAPHLIMAHCAVRPSIARVEVWNRTPERARALVERLEIQGVRLAVADDLEASARRAEVITCATMAIAPLIRGRWLAPGTHLDLVGSFTPEMHECDLEAIHRSSVFVDSRWSAVRDCGEIVSALANGALRREDLRADLFELARGIRPGRTRPDEITLFKNGGGGHLDLMVAQYLCAR
jgi:ornithine cyclodeaminase